MKLIKVQQLWMENQAGKMMCMKVQSGTSKVSIFGWLDPWVKLALVFAGFLLATTFLGLQTMTINGFIGMEMLGHPHQTQMIYKLLAWMVSISAFPFSSKKKFRLKNWKILRFFPLFSLCFWFSLWWIILFFFLKRLIFIHESPC